MKIKFTLALLLIVALISFSFKSKKYHPLYSSGPASVLEAGYTGASFDNSGANCSACHGGGIYNPTVTLELLNSSNVPVTSYTAGASYTVRLSIIASAGTPQFGFQIMNARASNNANINSWGTTLPTNVKNTLTSGGRNYIEHSAKLTNGILDIPWTAPIATTGTVNFYGVGNAVDGLGGSGGDNAVSTNLSIAESALPIKLINFEGKEEKGNVDKNKSKSCFIGMTCLHLTT